MLRRIVKHPLTRLVIAAVIVYVLAQALGIALVSTRVFPITLATVEAVSGIAGLASLLFVGLVIERRTLAGIGFPADRLLPDLGRGFLLGAVLLTVVVGGMALAGWYSVLGFAGDGAANLALLGLAATALIGIAEEVVSRGILFRILEEWLGSWIALAFSALAFGLAHLANPNSSLWAGLAIALEAGVLFGAVYILSRNLWLPIGLHWSWNFFEGWVYGTPVSGLDTPGLVHSSIAGPTLWTGGAFGPEAGLVAVILCGAAGVYIIVRCVRQGKTITPPWLARLTGRPNPLSLRDERSTDSAGAD